MSEFLADAAVLIRADTTAFRAQLLTEVNASVAAAQAAVKPIVVPVSATTTGVSAAAAGAQQVAAGLKAQTTSTLAAAAASKKLQIQNQSILATNRSLAAADRALTRARSEVLGATDAAAAAATRFSRAQTAVARAQIAVERAARGTNAVQKTLAANALLAAEAFEAEALAALDSARALKVQSVEAAKAGAVNARLASGAGASALAQAGLRGAILGANSVFIAGTVAALGFGKALQTAASFEADLNVLRVTTGATAAEMERVSKTAQALGTDITLPGVAAGDAAQAMQLLARAGLDVNESIDATRGVLQLATAAEITNAEATQLAASALNAFGLAGDQAVKVADVLANAANASQASITDMGIALQQSSAVARQVGISFQDTATFLTLLAKNGLQGSDAGTSLRVALTRLINPTEKAQNVIRRLGIQLRDVNGNIRPQIFSDFAAAQQNLSRKQQDANAAIVFGTDALRAYSIISREGQATFAETASILDRNGTAAEIAAARMTGLTGSAENLKNQMSQLGLSIGQVATPLATSLVHGLTLATKGFNLAFAAADRFFNKSFDLDTTELDDLQGRLDEIIRQTEDFESSGSFIPPSLAADAEAVVTRIEEIGKALLATPDGVQKFSDAFSRASPQIAAALRDGIITPAEETKIAVTDMGRAFINIAPEKLFSGGFSRLKSEVAGIKDTFEDLGRDVIAAFEVGATSATSPAFDQIAAGIVAEAKTTASLIVEQLGASLAVAQARGDQGAELSILRTQEKNQEKFLNAVLGREQTKKNLVLAKKAALNLKSTRDQITAIVKQNVDDAEKDRDEADQAVIDGLSAGRTSAQRAVDRARASEDPTDDIPALLAFRKRLENEVAQVQAGVKDGKAKTAQLRRLSDELFQNAQDIQAVKRARNKAIAASVEEQRADLRSAAEATGNIQLLIRLLDQDIADAREVLAKARKAKQGQQVAAEALKALQKQKRDLINQAREDVLASAFRIAEAQGNESLMLQILDLQIAQAKREVTQAKGLAEKLKEQADVQDLIAQRRELLAEKVKDSTEAGTTVLDLLTESTRIFNQSAGNLIGFNQPFASASAFNADFAQFLTRRPVTPGAGGADTEMRVDRFRPSKEATESNRVMQQLIAALQQLTNATLQASGNSSTAGLTKAAVGALGARGAAMGVFYESRQALKWQEAESG